MYPGLSFYEIDDPLLVLPFVEEVPGMSTVFTITIVLPPSGDTDPAGTMYIPALFGDNGWVSRIKLTGRHDTSLASAATPVPLSYPFYDEYAVFTLNAGTSSSLLYDDTLTLPSTARDDASNQLTTLHAGWSVLSPAPYHTALLLGAMVLFYPGGGLQSGSLSDLSDT